MEFRILHGCIFYGRRMKRIMEVQQAADVRARIAVFVVIFFLSIKKKSAILGLQRDD